MSSLRVLQIGKFYAPIRGGMESHVKTLSDGLRSRTEVEVVVSSHALRTTYDLIDGIPVTRVGTLGQVLSTSINPALTAVIRRSKAEVIHLHWPNPMAAVAYLMSGHHGALCVTYHSDVLKQRIANLFFEPVLKALLRRADAIFVSSEDYCEGSAVLRSFRKKVHRIPFGVDAQHFKAPDPELVRQARERYGDNVVLSVGRLVDYKGFDILIRAMATAPGTLVLAGEGSLRSELEALLRATRLERRIFLTGSLPDKELHALYRAADVFVLASINRREAFGLVQAEAMAAGLPVINTTIDSGAQFVSLHGVTGLTIPPSDVKATSAAITRLLTDKATRAKYGQSARLRAQELFQPSDMASLTLEAYEQIAAKYHYSSANMHRRTSRSTGLTGKLTQKETSYSPGE